MIKERKTIAGYVRHRDNKINNKLRRSSERILVQIFVKGFLCIKLLLNNYVSENEVETVRLRVNAKAIPGAPAFL